MRGGIPGIPEKEQQVGAGLGQDLDHLEGRKPPGPVLLPQLGEEYGRKAVGEEYDTYVYIDVPVSSVAHPLRQPPSEEEHQQEKYRRHRRDCGQRTGEHPAGLIALLVGEAETAGLQSHGQQDLQDRDIGHELRQHTVIRRRERIGVQRQEHVVEEAGHYGAGPVDCRLSGQFAEYLSHSHITSGISFLVRVP